MFTLLSIMDTRPNTALDDAIASARALPTEQQEALAVELSERVAQFKDETMSDTDRAEAARRLAAPARYADAEKVRAFFARHGVRG
jgi:hypothetical protein